jgi:phenylacetate-CoA ligase
MKPWDLYYLHLLLKNQWKSRDELGSIRDLKLRKLIRHAHARVPYYRQLFESVGLSPHDIRTAEDLRHIPVTSRDALQALELRRKMAEGIQPESCRQSATSGTTASPLRVYATAHDSTVMAFGWARAFLARGMRPWYKMVAFKGQKDVGTRRSWYERLGLWRRREVSTWDGPAAWIGAIREWKPHVLVGYEMTLRILAEAVRDGQIDGIAPARVFHSSGILDRRSRALIESVLRTTVVDIYGSDEGGCMAWECDTCEGYHICSDTVIVEILSNGEPVKPGEEGEVVITNLSSYAMPFIRYRQGDVAVLSPEAPVCGRGFSLLRGVQGRTDDYVVLRDGQRISPHPVYHCIDPVHGIRRWRVVQETIDRLTVELEPGEGFDGGTVDTVRSNLEKLTGGQIEVAVLRVRGIPVDPLVKFRSVTSRIARRAS